MSTIDAAYKKKVMSASLVIRVLLGSALMLLSSCAQYGPEAMRVSRLAYNEALQNSEQRELLLNLVRLRYTDAPEFLEVSGISTQMSFETRASLGATLGDLGSETISTAAPEVAAGFSESPTVTFVPRRDKEFTRQLVAPLELDTLYLLSRYGWSIDRIMMLIATDINGLRNSLSREGFDEDQSDLEEFYRVVSQLRELEEERLITISTQKRSEPFSPLLPAESLSADDVLNAHEKGYQVQMVPAENGYVVTEDKLHYQLAIENQAWELPALQAVSNRLGLRAGQTTYEIDTPDSSQISAIQISTRSVLGIMAYLSNAIDVPTPHADLVGRPGTGSTIMQNLFMVKASATQPEHAYLTVQYRDHWYYIDDEDIQTKRTLGLLTSIIRLTISAGGAQNVPLLTLPVAR